MPRPERVLLPAVLYALLALASLAGAVYLARQVDPERAKALGRWSTAADVAGYGFSKAMSSKYERV